MYHLKGSQVGGALHGIIILASESHSLTQCTLPANHKAAAVELFYQETKGLG